jgi:predicted nucleic-acid-binding Zn-ribbon protein
MKTSLHCPKCERKRFVILSGVEVPERMSRRLTTPLPAIVVCTPGILGSEVGESWTELGGFEVWICTGCGYTETYAHGLERIDELAANFPGQVRVLDAGISGRGPYR